MEGGKTEGRRPDPTPPQPPALEPHSSDRDSPSLLAPHLFPLEAGAGSLPHPESEDCPLGVWGSYLQGGAFGAPTVMHTALLLVKNAIGFPQDSLVLP